MVYRKTMNETAYGILKIKFNEKEKRKEGIHFKGKRGNVFSFEEGDIPHFCTRSKANRKDHSSP